MDRKKLRNLVFLMLLFALTVWSVFHGEDLRSVLYYLATADLRYIAAGILCVIGFILGESVVIFYLLRILGSRVRFFHCCLYSFVGFFYSCITPSASGGQPMQVMMMRRDRIPVPVSTVVLALVTITYKLVLVFLGLIVLCVRPPQIMAYLEPAESLIVIGLILNVVCVAALLLLVFHPSLVHAAAVRCMMVLHRIRPFHNLEKQMIRLQRLADQYYGTAEFYRNNRHVVVRVFLITLLQRCCLFLVTWFTYRAFDLSSKSLWVILTLQGMISVAVDMLPLPGGMGISENLFLLIFEPVFGEELLLPAMVVSRGIGYYTQLLISAVMTAAACLIIREKSGQMTEIPEGKKEGDIPL